MAADTIRGARKAGRYLLLSFVALSVVFPIYAVLLQALKSGPDAFDHPRWKGEVVVFSGNTDCYQPLEASWQLTRQCLQVCAEYRNPVGIITKSTLIERDLELLAEIARTSHLTVTVSVPFAACTANSRIR